MADKKKRTLRQQRANQATEQKPRRLQSARTKASGRLRKAAGAGQREYHPVKLPDSRAGRLLNKRVRIMPKFMTEAWTEIRQVTWPTRNETIRLSTAVFIFSVIFTAIVAALDAGLDKIFRELIIK